MTNCSTDGESTAVNPGTPIYAFYPAQKGQHMDRFLLVIASLCIGFSATGCASRAAAQSSDADFHGAWSVQWCDKAAPEADCGGFDVDLSQQGDKLSGESFGARPRLSQIDEGGVIRGVAVGDSAILAIESRRSGGIYLVKVTVEGDCMRWKVRDTVREPEGDIDIIALDDVLTRRPRTAAETESVDCRGLPVRPKD